MGNLLQDLRFGVRMLLKHPGFTLIAVLTLALGIGANTAIFSIVNAVLLRQLPYPEPSRLVVLWSTMVSQGVSTSGSSLPDYREWRDQNHVFDGLAGYYLGDFNLSGAGQEPERVQGGRITANLFEVLGVSPAMGRGFLPEEEKWGNNRVVILSYELWQRRYNSDAGLIGRAITVGGTPYTVVGVMPKGMPFFDNQPKPELWSPISFPAGDNMDSRNNYFVNLVGRLKPGVTVEQAQADVTAIANRIQEKSEEKVLGGLVVPLREQLVGDVRPMLLVLLGAVAFVLLVACVNVANLLLARATSRERELAIRASLGASRRRIIRQLAVESLPLGLLGSTAGLLLAVWGIDLLTSLLPESLPRHNPITIDPSVLLFTLGISLVTALIFALLPAFQAAKADVQAALNEGGRSGTQGRRQGRLRGLLIASEMALALVLLIGAGLMIESFLKLRRVDTGFSAENVLTMRIALPSAKYPERESVNDPQPVALNFYERLLERVKTLPGVEGAGVSTNLPLGAGNTWGKLFSIEGRPLPTSMAEVPIVNFALVSPEYLSALRINVQRGRAFNEHDTENSQQVAIISEATARKHFQGEDPLGKTIWMGPPESLMPPELLKAVGRFERRTVVGVVTDVKGSSLAASSEAMVYVPYTQSRKEGWSNSMMLAVRTSSAPESMAAAIRKEVYALDPDQPVSNVLTMQERLNQSLSQPRFSALLLGLFALVALVLAAVGIYGVISYSVTQRTHEIGIRMALGASARDILKMVVGQGMILTLIGVGVGLVASFLLTRFLASLLFEVSSFDPLTYLGVSLLLLIIAFIACYIPARRATRVDPMVALRYE
ncbi:MAG TPA: ABC transporter permease [Pyrinomonadaceae bacterium]|nr:ABC transporter permease [Pyrinomonadaceae bacterium]